MTWDRDGASVDVIHSILVNRFLQHDFDLNLFSSTPTTFPSHVVCRPRRHPGFAP